MQRLRPEDFDSWADYYWAYQCKLAEGFYVPWLQSRGFAVEDKRILDVGCGIGGFLAAFLPHQPSYCLGVEIHSFPWPATEGIEYRVLDVQQPLEAPIEPFDLIILRDVFEHIPNSQKRSFLQALRKFSHPKTRYLIAFPPWWSAFGLHQQVFAKTLFRNIPFLSWLPWKGLKPLLRLCGESEEDLKELEEVVNAGLSMRQFETLCKTLDWNIVAADYHLVRPSHELRYGVKTRRSFLSKLPILREVIVSGAVYLLEDHGFKGE